MTSLTGIDVHGAKGPIDWVNVAGAGFDFAFVKASEGKAFNDERLRSNVFSARAAGLQVGCYHFARPDAGTSPVIEAQHFLAQITGLGWNLPPVLDIERGSGDLSQWALAFLAAVEASTGVLPILYTYNGFIPGRLTDPALARHPLWLAAYQNHPPLPHAPWDQWAIWQHSSEGQVPGVPGRCDLNEASELPSVTPTPVEEGSALLWL